jgi:integrase/recombinase XerD
VTLELIKFAAFLPFLVFILGIIAGPSLSQKRVTPHVLRHTLTMDFLKHGVDRSVIALWLGHESIETTQIYIHANIELKEQALAKTEPFNGRPTHYQPTDQLLEFLQNL